MGNSPSSALVERKNGSPRHAKNTYPENLFTTLKDFKKKDMCENKVGYVGFQSTVRRLVEKEMRHDSGQNVFREKTMKPEKQRRKTSNNNELASIYDGGSEPHLSSRPDFLERFPLIDQFLHAKGFHSGSNQSKEKLKKMTKWKGKSGALLHEKQKYNGDELVLTSYLPPMGSSAYPLKDDAEHPRKGKHKSDNKFFHSQDGKGRVAPPDSLGKLGKTLKCAIREYKSLRNRKLVTGDELEGISAGIEPGNETLADILYREDVKHKKTKNSATGNGGSLETLEDIIFREESTHRKAKRHAAKARRRRTEDGKPRTSKSWKTQAGAFFHKKDGIQPSDGSVEFRSLNEMRFPTASPDMKGVSLRNRKKELQRRHSAPSLIQTHARKPQPVGASSPESGFDATKAFDEGSMEEGSSTSSDLGPFDDLEQLDFSFVFPILSGSPHTRKMKIPGNFVLKTENLSPVSVIDGVFVDYISNPAKEAAEVQETNLKSLPSEPDAKLEEYDGLALLEASGIGSSELFEDPKLLLDCANEVLGEIRGRLRSGWMHLIRPIPLPIPYEGHRLEQEICKRVGRHLTAHLATTMDELVEMQLDSEPWIDLSFDMESTIFDVGDDVVIDLLEECIADVCQF